MPSRLPLCWGDVDTDDEDEDLFYAEYPPNCHPMEKGDDEAIDDENEGDDDSSLLSYQVDVDDIQKTAPTDSGRNGAKVMDEEPDFLPFTMYHAALVDIVPGGDDHEFLLAAVIGRQAMHRSELKLRVANRRFFAMFRGGRISLKSQTSLRHRNGPFWNFPKYNTIWGKCRKYWRTTYMVGRIQIYGGPACRCRVGVRGRRCTILYFRLLAHIVV